MPELNLVEFDYIAGAAVHYARYPVAHYGTIGVGPRKVRLNKEFKDKLEICLKDLWKVCEKKFGCTPLILVTSGCYVEKAGRHAQGTAIDIDSIWWASGKNIITRDAEKDPGYYLGAEAVLRKHFDLVLNHWYNRAHKDHWHVDNKILRGDEMTRSKSLFLQAALVYIFGKSSIDIDGCVGPKTLKVLKGIGYSIDTQWDKFLDMVIKTVF